MTKQMDATKLFIEAMNGAYEIMTKYFSEDIDKMSLQEITLMYHMNQIFKRGTKLIEVQQEQLDAIEEKLDTLLSRTEIKQ